MSTAQFWEDRYAGSDSAVWSGRANQVLADVAAALTPGRALDLGCGEGADAVWLAKAGWEVTAVDISVTAVERGRAAAAAADLASNRIAWLAADLADWRPDGSYDLVSACFFQSPVDLPRAAILCRAAAAVTPGGSVLIVSHAAPPPWASQHHHHADLLGPAEELAALELDPRQWEVVLAEVRERPAVGPDGQRATLADTVVRVLRLPAANADEGRREEIRG